MSIVLQSVTKTFGGFTALHNVNLTIHPGELVALLGPSGSGKTTLLRIIAGLEVPDRGGVYLNGEEVTHQRARDRHVGFVFQHYALFRHMSVFENVAFGLRVRPRRTRLGEQAIRQAVRNLLKLVQLEGMASRYPSQLSGGQRQRVALARTLAVEPKVLLLDEPFGSLDARVRKELRRWLRRLHDELHITSVFVTHDQEEALELADRVVVLNEGVVLQVGTPEEVYHTPATPFVYHFLGDVNLFHARVEAGQARVGSLTLDLDGRVAEDGTARLYVRPHQLQVSVEPPGDRCFAATVEHVHAAGPAVRIRLRSEWGTEVEVEMSQERYHALGVKKGAPVFVGLRPADIFMDNGLKAASGQAGTRQTP